MSEGFDRYLEANRERFLEELRELTAQPSIAIEDYFSHLRFMEELITRFKE